MKHINVNLENKIILVTGAAGFIGSNLVMKLLESIDGIHVIGIDNCNDYYDVNLKDYRLKEIEKFSDDGEEFLLVIPVPLTKARLRERGYNQAALLAEGMTSALTEKGYRAVLREDILEKTRDTAQQKHMGYMGRMENVAGAYHIHKRKDCREQTVVLVDDIMTTGATGSECASRLLSAGAKKVFFTVAAARPEQK